MDELRRTIRDYVVREYLETGDDRSIDEQTPLITGGIVDSFSMVSLKRFLEMEYDIEIPDAQATPAAFDTVAGIADLVERLRKESPCPTVPRSDSGTSRSSNACGKPVS
jgi:acyl carrier protein